MAAVKKMTIMIARLMMNVMMLELPTIRVTIVYMAPTSQAAAKTCSIG